MLHALRHSVLFKMAGLALLTLLMALPLAQIGQVNQERGLNQQEAASELGRTHAGSQTLTGPLVVLPYVEHWTEMQRSADGKVTGEKALSRRRSHVVLPERLHLEGEMAPQERYRGIFKIPFYRLQATLEGEFPPFDAAGIVPAQAGARVEALVPFVVFRVGDLRGLDGTPRMELDGQALPLRQGIPGAGEAGAQALHAPLAGAALASWQAGKAVPFKLQLGLVGQKTLAVVPSGSETTAHLVSSWPAPSFGGDFLAAQRTVRGDGFDAHWRVSALVSKAREQVRRSLEDADGAPGPAPAAGAGTDPENFAVSLVEPVNVYSMSTRAGKYGLLFISLVLLAAFMFDQLRRLHLHPLQYALVGLSIALFFLLLLALSEKLVFWLAYALAASASVALLALYFGAILQGWRRGLGFGAYVALLYGALYGLLASESNALLLGALLTFGLLAFLMLATRRVDWYALSGDGNRP